MNLIDMSGTLLWGKGWFVLLAVLVFRCDSQFVLLYVYAAVLVGLSPSNPGPRVNCACPKSDMLSCVQYRHRVTDTFKSNKYNHI